MFLPKRESKNILSVEEFAVSVQRPTLNALVLMVLTLSVSEIAISKDVVPSVIVAFVIALQVAKEH